MSLLSVLQPLTGLFFLVSSSLSSASSVLLPVDCVTRGADLAQDRSLVLCPPACTQGRVSVFGTRTFASVSSVCGAAIHRGVLGPSGGPVRVHKLPGRHNYLSSLSHGVQSQALSHWSSSFSVTKPVSAPLELTSATSATALPAAQPAKKPTKKKLTVKKALTTGNKDCKIDIAMVIDSSNNIGQRRFNLQKNFLIKLAAMLKVGQTGPHIGVIQASDTPRTEFLLTNYTQPKELLFAIKELAYLGGDSNTGKAITHTTETFFNQESGGRRGYPRVMVVLIDGWPSDSLEQHPTKDDVLAALRRISYMSGGTATGEAISYCAQNLFRRTAPGRNFLIVVTDGQSYDDVRRPAMEARAQGITIFSVGVAWAPLDDLRAMSSEPKDSHTFFTRDFSGLSELVPVLVRGICRDFSEKN
eukprot:XP_011618408.1 PREDICTED: cochlin [Takifugu rubripes]